MRWDGLKNKNQPHNTGSGSIKPDMYAYRYNFASGGGAPSPSRASPSRMFITSNEFECWPTELQETVFQTAYRLAPASSAFALSLDGDYDFTPDFLEEAVHRRLRLVVNR